MKVELVYMERGQTLPTVKVTIEGDREAVLQLTTTVEYLAKAAKIVEKDEQT